MTEKEYQDAVAEASRLYSHTYNCMTVEKMQEKKEIHNAFVEKLIAESQKTAEQVRKDVTEHFDENYYGKIEHIKMPTHYRNKYNALCR